MIKWDEFETGDLLLFHGSGFWFSYVVEWLTWSEYSHIGIVLRDPTYLDPKLKGIYMLESGTEKFPDAIEHRVCYGVQIVNLETVFKNYIGRIYYRKLYSPLELKEKFPQVLQETWQKIKDQPYDDALWDLLRVEIELPVGDLRKDNTFFCSALVTYLYLQFELLLNRDIRWGLIRPKDFDTGGYMEKQLRPNIRWDPVKQLFYKKC